MRMQMIAACAPLLLAGTAAADLMVPDWTNDRIMLFSEADGSLIDANWITDVGAAGWQFSSPKEAGVVGKEIWVSDQIEDAIHRFDFDRNFLGSITAHFNSGASLDNLRGFGVVGSSVYLTCFHSTTANRGVVIYNFAGTPTGFFQAAPTTSNSLFDVAPLGSDILVANSSVDDVQRYTTAGAFVNNFAVDIEFVQQTHTMPEGTVLGLSTIATPGVEGIYHWNADGSLIRYIDTEAIKTAFGQVVPQAGWSLGDGNYLITTNNGVYKYLVGSNTFTQVLADVNGQFINPIDLGDCPADINGDDTVDVNDLLLLIGAWGSTGPTGDINDDDIVDVNDLLLLIGAWGDC